MRVAIVGSGVAGLASAYHWLEMWRAHPGSDPLHLTLYAALVPHDGSDGSGLGGKAMSRHFEGYIDHAHNDMPRHPFYGPMMPWRGTVPHGYHVLWEYPNLRRMLGDSGDGMGLLRPEGGARVIASFQARMDERTPGGPGIGLMGLCDPQTGLAFRLETKVLFRLKDRPVAAAFIAAMRTLFSVADIDPLSFSDLFFAHEVDLELRISLLVASIRSRTMNPETETIDGRPLYEVEYDIWAEKMVTEWAKPMHALLDPLKGLIDDFTALGAILEEGLEGEGAPAPDENFDVDNPDERAVAELWLASQLERVLRDLPGALARLGAGDYPIWRTLHFRFAPDATFTSPYSFDAAQAARSLAFCFSRPMASRMWTPDGGQIQRLWLRFWERIRALAAADPRVEFEVIEGRVHRLTSDDSGISIEAGPYSGHTGDLGMPWAPTLHAAMHAPSPIWPAQRYDQVITTCAPGALECILDGEKFADSRRTLGPLTRLGNETLEIILWTDAPIEWSGAARVGMQEASITGLEGAFCLVADYRCGLWSDARLAEERPFGAEIPFVGSIIESCGGFEELYACETRTDAYGWPREVKERIRDLLSKPEFFDEIDPRPWPHDEHGWRAEREAGSWKPSKATDPATAGEWFEACRWLAWGYVRQLSLIKALGERAVRQLSAYAGLLDPRGRTRDELLHPPAELTGRVRYVVMRNAKARNRIFSPGAGVWPKRPVSGVALGDARLFPAGDWTRNGLDIVCMEAATLSAMRASRAAYRAATGVEPGVAPPIAVLPPQSWYDGNDPMKRG